MTDVFTKAAEARALQDDPRLAGILDDIVAEAVAVFRRPVASPDEISAAHAKVRAADVIRSAIQARIDSATFEQHRDQHRGRHD